MGYVVSDKPPNFGVESYWLTRALFLRCLGFIYFLAFFSLLRQLKALIGADGLLPAALYLEKVSAAIPGGFERFLAVPSVFWLGSSDAVMLAACGLGALGALALMGGIANAGLCALLWALYSSLVNVGQIFYGYGWEMMLLEAGFLSIFLCPLLEWRPSAKTPPPQVVIWFLRWMLFRVMFGAGMIKIRGDACWRDLTCLLYHYETQPIPNPLSWYFHQLPPIVHKAGVLFNHFAELIVPWAVFAPARLRRVRIFGGVILVAFQVGLILSGNLSWLNYLTIALCISCFDDRCFAAFFPKLGSEGLFKDIVQEPPGRKVVVGALTALVVILSVNPARNMLSPKQAMNFSYDPFHLINTYGAFGAVGKERYEVILQGTADVAPTQTTRWIEYEFPCKPGDVARRPCVVSPYHRRLDWQIWFAAMSPPQHNPWLIHLAYKLLKGDTGALSLLAGDPFPNAPPKFIRAEFYRYRFTSRGDKTKAWWKRERVAPYLPPLSLAP